MQRDPLLVRGESPAVPSVESFVDERGSALRVSWHDDRAMAVVSTWRDGECVATVRLTGADLMRLSTMLTQAWIHGLTSSADVGV